MKAKAPHLLIVSDSPMWAFPEGVSVFEPTLREIEYVTQLFPRITWIGFANKDMQRMAGGMDKTGRIQFILLPLTGGKGIKNKLTQFAYLFYYVYVILKNLRSATYVHSRAPSIPAWLVIGLSRWDKKRFYWHKYAGNWNQENPPF